MRKEGSLFFLATVDKVKFRNQVRPGDKVRIEVKNMRVSKKMIKQSGKAYVIRPEKPLDISAAESDPKELRRVYEMGRKTALEQLEAIKEFLM